MGGSVWIDKTNAYGFGANAVFYVMSMPPAILTVGQAKGGIKLGDMGIAYFVASKGLGTPVDYSGMLAQVNPYRFVNQPNFRDPFVFEDPDGRGLDFAISVNDHIEFWRIKDGALGKNAKSLYNTDGVANFKSTNLRENDCIEYLSSMDVRNPGEAGVEVPNVVYLGNGKWYISCSIQDKPQGGALQHTNWYLCTWNSKKQRFESYERGNHEYGEEGYAQRVNDPNQMTMKQIDDSGKAPTILSRTMATNWAFDWDGHQQTDIWPWFLGLYPTEQLVTNDDKTTMKMEPLDFNKGTIKGFNGFNVIPYDASTNSAILHFNPIDHLKNNEFKLHFNYGDFGMYYDEPTGKLIWDNKVNTSIPSYLNITSPLDSKGDADDSDDIEVIWNYTQIIIFNVTKGWVAHFMLPQGTKLTLTDEQQLQAKSWEDGNPLDKNTWK